MKPSLVIIIMLLIAVLSFSGDFILYKKIAELSSIAPRENAIALVNPQNNVSETLLTDTSAPVASEAETAQTSAPVVVEEEAANPVEQNISSGSRDIEFEYAGKKFDGLWYPATCGRKTTTVVLFPEWGAGNIRIRRDEVEAEFLQSSCVNVFIPSYFTASEEETIKINVREKNLSGSSTYGNTLEDHFKIFVEDKTLARKRAEAAVQFIQSSPSIIDGKRVIDLDNVIVMGQSFGAVLVIDMVLQNKLPANVKAAIAYPTTAGYSWEVDLDTLGDGTVKPSTPFLLQVADKREESEKEMAKKLISKFDNSSELLQVERYHVTKIQDSKYVLDKADQKMIEFLYNLKK